MNKQLIAFRKKLHAEPELGGHEQKTQDKITSFLKDHDITKLESVGKYGTLCRFEFGDGPHVLVRVDIDALPIQEVNDFDHKSTEQGVSHKCGHDGHATIGLALALALKDKPFSKGRVTLLFQPSEENGEGARGILADDNFDPDDFDHAVALHNIPGKPMHEVIWKDGSFTPAVQSLIIKLKGKTSHAAEPKKGINPSYAIADIILKARKLEQLDETHPDYNLITPVYSSIGSTDYGISAGFGEVHFTIRSWKQARMDEVTQNFTKEVEQIARDHKLKMSTDIVASFAANQNDETVNNAIKKATKALDLKAREKKEPFPWGEDFGLITQKIPGAMFGLGAGEDTPALHNPDYDFPDALIESGSNMFYETAKALCEDV